MPGELYPCDRCGDPECHDPFCQKSVPEDGVVAQRSRVASLETAVRVENKLKLAAKNERDAAIANATTLRERLAAAERERDEAKAALRKTEAERVRWISLTNELSRVACEHYRTASAALQLGHEECERLREDVATVMADYQDCGGLMDETTGKCERLAAVLRGLLDADAHCDMGGCDCVATAYSDAKSVMLCDVHRQLFDDAVLFEDAALIRAAVAILSEADEKKARDG